MASRSRKINDKKNLKKKSKHDDMEDENDLDDQDQADLAAFNNDQENEDFEQNEEVEQEDDDGDNNMQENLQDIDEEDEDELEQINNEYQIDDFVVADDIDESQRRKKKKKKRKKERKLGDEEDSEAQEELDEDDLLLIQDNKEQNIIDKQHKRLKRVANIAQEQEDDDMDIVQEQEVVHEQMDQANKMENELEQIRIRKDGDSSGDEFIDDDNVNDEYAQEVNKEKLEEKNQQNRQIGGQGEISSNLQQLIDVFGDINEQDMEDEIVDNDMEIVDDQQKLMKKKTIQEIFEPAEIEDLYQTQDDEYIKKTDIPERIQLRNKHRQKLLPSNKELVDETNWICEKMLQNKNPSPANPEDFKKKILKTLEYLTVHNMEVMYLFFYKKFELLPDLSLQDLWDIFELDFEWSTFNQSKEALIKDFDQLQEYQKISPYIQDMLKTNNTKTILNYLQEYCNFHYSKYVDKNQDVQSTYKRPISKPFAREAVQFRLDHFAQMAGLSADQLAENILLETKSKMANFDSHIPKFYDITPDKAAEEYLNENSLITNQILTTLTNLCIYMAQEIFYQPVIRKYVRDIYFEKVSISTEPTAKGIKELDVTKYRFAVKRIKNRPLKYFTDEIFMQMLECEKLQLIKITFNLPWQEDLKSTQKNFKDIKDEIYQRLLQNSITPYDSNLTEAQNEIVNKWNILRGEAIKNYLSDYMYPHLEKAVRADLTEISQKYIISQCGKKFRDMLYVGPYQPDVSNSQQKREEARICAVVFEKETNKLTTVFLNQYGELQDHQTYKYLVIPNIDNKNSNHDQHTKTNYFKDKRDFEEKLELHKPDCIVVSTNCIEARRIKVAMSNLVKKEKNDQDSETIHVSYGDYIVPQLYSKTYKSTKDFPNHNNNIREAISLGRTKQNQMAEILNLWNENLNENAALFIPFHPLQSMVSQFKLKQEYERIAIQTVNEVGVDINLIVKHRHLQAQLQFICGLGPRKAQHLIEQIQLITDQNAQLLFRLEIWARKMLDKTVYINCIGFLKIKDHMHHKNEDNEDESPQHSTSEKDILDQTRIHPENYVLAKKIAKDAIEEEGKEEEESAELVEKVMKNPQKLDDLDLDDYAQHLAYVKQKPNMIHLLKFIVDELTIPFKDPRQFNKEIDQKELFYKVSKESPQQFKPYSFATVRVLNFMSNKKIIQCKILQNNLIGNINKESLDPADQKLPEDKLQEKYAPGTILQARIKKIDFSQFRVDLTIKQQDMQTNQNILEELIPNWKNFKDTFVLKEDEDYPIFAQQKQKDGRKYIPRRINHPQFRNMSYVAAVEYLSDKNMGDFVIRPSSKGTDYLNITWKFYDHVIAHLEIKEGQKQPNDLIAKKLILQQQAYESLDEIIDKYIKPCNQFMLGITAFKKFIKSGIEALEQDLREEKDNDPKHIPYYFCCSEQAPQYAILGYMPKKDEIIKEYIKVKPNGLFFHNYYFTSLQMLVSWFKENFKTPEYQRYLRKIKPPVQMEVHGQMQMNKQQSGFSPSYGQGENNLSYGYGIKDEKKLKNDQDGSLQDRICNTCGQKGHLANECPQSSNWNQQQDNNQQRGGWQQNQDRQQERKPYNQNRKPGTCFNCGEEGHMKNECTKEKRINQKGGPGGDKKCFNCGESGHFSNNCPNPKNENNRGRGGFRGGRQNRGDQGRGGRNFRNKSRSRSRSKEHGNKQGGKKEQWGNTKNEQQQQDGWEKTNQMDEEQNTGGWAQQN